MRQPPDGNRIVVNKALRRRSGFFGFNTGLAIMSMLVLCFGLILGQFLPINITVALTMALFIATIYVFRDGTDPILSKLRRPRHYTRGGFPSAPLMGKYAENEQSSTKKKRKK